MTINVSRMKCFEKYGRTREKINEPIESILKYRFRWCSKPWAFISHNLYDSILHLVYKIRFCRTFLSGVILQMHSIPSPSASRWCATKYYVYFVKIFIVCWVFQRKTHTHTKNCSQPKSNSHHIDTIIIIIARGPKWFETISKGEQ